MDIGSKLVKMIIIKKSCCIQSKFFAKD